MKAELQVRGEDRHGAGYYGAPRGDRKHRGIDYECLPNTIIFPDRFGKVTKLGYPYSRDWRYFYLNPLVILSEEVDTNTPIGTVQDLTLRYPGITCHCHKEVKKGGEYINPDTLV